MRIVKYIKISLILLIVSWTIIQCKKESNPNNNDSYQSFYEDGEEYTAGLNGTVFDASINAFNNQIPGLNDSDQSDFIVGNSFNRNNWVIAPSSTKQRDGLGPLYNALSCSGCHDLDGRGRPPYPGEKSTSLVIRLSQAGGLTGIHGQPLPLTDYGDQLNNKSIPDVEDEREVIITYQESEGQYPDGTKYSLRIPKYTFTNGALSNALFSPRVAPKMAGPGFVDAIPDNSILANADELDLNQDGISGKPNYVWDYFLNKKVLGKIGWKSNIPNVKNQVAHAFLNDIGITSTQFPQENLYGNQIINYGNLPNGGTPEISDYLLFQVYYYTTHLAMPARRDYKDNSVLKGKMLFNKIGCNKCHISTFTTSNHPEFPDLNNQKIHPYSDFLLHDMGPGLSDNRPDYDASGQEWRTSPLWGLGLVKVVNNHTFLLHDGRARNTEEAILWHAGEASTIKTLFMSLSKSEREAIIRFVESL